MKYWFKLGIILLVFFVFLSLAYFCNGPTFSFQSKAEVRWSHIVIHHTAANNNTLYSIDYDHRVNHNWEGIGYHFLIGNGVNMGDGKVEETFRYRQLKDGAHALTPDQFYNRHGIGICLVGNFNQTQPTDHQMEALKELIRYLKTTYDIPNQNIVMHQEVKPTDCPGKLFPKQELRKWLIENFKESDEIE